MSEDSPTAAVLIIGDEILSGRTKDANLGIIAEWASVMGLDLREARVVSDIEDDIVAAVNALRQRYTYVFTTGGIGPTHDDITADAVGKAFGLPVRHDPEAVRILKDHFARMGREANEARMRMARMPEGAVLIENAVSRAPGFRVENVFVMAGIPKVMTAMLESISKMIEPGRPMLSESVTVEATEGDIAGPLKDIQARHGPVMIGCYPRQTDKGFCATIVVRSRDQAALAAAMAEVHTLAERLGRA
ncbi:MAG: competence/damage-inducible protein A [Hyphomicrobiales bacterium]